MIGSGGQRRSQDCCWENFGLVCASRADVQLVVDSWRAEGTWQQKVSNGDHGRGSNWLAAALHTCMCLICSSCCTLARRRRVGMSVGSIRAPRKAHRGGSATREQRAQGVGRFVSQRRELPGVDTEFHRRSEFGGAMFSLARERP
ncbi:hypothetical protein LZ32DRAFT_394689 [Colletotrichum eremochloae]|nr:hypothetical protein LZ32DRAFT_394689 [Colletotrichum eremochloae]